MNNTDLKFFTNEPERDLYSRFAAILKSNTQFFDVLVGYFRASGFFKMYEALENIEKIRILVGLNVDRFTVKIIDRATNEAKVAAISVADGKEIIARDNECSLKRHNQDSTAYFNCHTDITIPYNELGAITVIKKDGSTEDIIRDGRFVVPGTEALNVPLEEYDAIAK